MRETVLEAVLRSADAPSEAQRNRFAAFLKKQYGQEVPLRWEQDPALEKGFRMEVGADLYDWSLEGRLRQFRERLEQLNPAGVSVIPLMREAVRNWQPDVAPEEVGSVLTVGDEIATVSGLEHAAYGEILQFSSGVKGMVQDLRPDRVGCILFGGSEAIESGSIVRRTGKTAGIPVGDGFLGRVVDALGMPIDGQGDIPSEGYLPIESPAPGIIDRQPVNAPMETGLLAIDSMFPIGRGQRELIIGDRQTGKTAIALDTVLNQKGKGVVCAREGGIAANTVICRYLGEVYPPWAWFEKQDLLKQKLKDFGMDGSLPEFYNIMLERPAESRDGYDVLYIDPIFRGNFGSRISHSCAPNCATTTITVDGRLAIVLCASRGDLTQSGAARDFPRGGAELRLRVRQRVEDGVRVGDVSLRCRGSFVSYADGNSFMQVMAKRFPFVKRTAVLLDACDATLSEADSARLAAHGIKVFFLSFGAEE